MNALEVFESENGEIYIGRSASSMLGDGVVTAVMANGLEISYYGRVEYYDYEYLNNTPDVYFN
jgi:hypothetical protein